MPRPLKAPLCLLVLSTSLVISHCLFACPIGDFDGDCAVDYNDLNLFTNQWLDIGGCSGPNCADLDASGKIDLVDYSIFTAFWKHKGSKVVINEIHYDPDVKTEQVEFVELYNTTSQSVDLSGWYFSRGFDFTFPPSTSLSPHGYIVIAENTNVFDPNSLRTPQRRGRGN
jgi:hypothetical protein